MRIDYTSNYRNAERLVKRPDRETEAIQAVAELLVAAVYTPDKLPLSDRLVQVLQPSAAQLGIERSPAE